ncbi:hypothetical protein FB471_3557 [Amycolatopsis cihanbeyliensis]|uniref:Uncharacterized protein n=2 Tax=Amycolatopsis cihanbeyliensis TaxID=1128664 RepID=A0A542DL21_AMYCI|nr:hypothetical protein FB471_3557 [Amycolatopsis cihanbeyliensis]
MPPRAWVGLAVAMVRHGLESNAPLATRKEAGEWLDELGEVALIACRGARPSTSNPRHEQ